MLVLLRCIVRMGCIVQKFSGNELSIEQCPIIYLSVDIFLSALLFGHSREFHISSHLAPVPGKHRVLASFAHRPGPRLRHRQWGRGATLRGRCAARGHGHCGPSPGPSACSSASLGAGGGPTAGASGAYGVSWGRAQCRRAEGPPAVHRCHRGRVATRHPRGFAWWGAKLWWSTAHTEPRGSCRDGCGEATTATTATTASTTAGASRGVASANGVAHGASGTSGSCSSSRAQCTSTSTGCQLSDAPCSKLWTCIQQVESSWSHTHRCLEGQGALETWRADERSANDCAATEAGRFWRPWSLLRWRCEGSATYVLHSFSRLCRCWTMQLLWQTNWSMQTGIITLWLFNIAMENCLFIDEFPIKTSIYGWDFPWLC